MRKLFAFSAIFAIIGIAAVVANGRPFSSTLGAPVVLISEEDGDPISRLRLLLVPNDSLTDDGGGTLSLDTSSGDADAVAVAASTTALRAILVTVGIDTDTLKTEIDGKASIDGPYASSADSDTGLFINSLGGTGNWQLKNDNVIFLEATGASQFIRSNKNHEFESSIRMANGKRITNKSDLDTALVFITDSAPERIRFEVDGSVDMVIDVNHRVGISTRIPQATLHISGSGIPRLLVESTSGDESHIVLKRLNDEWGMHLFDTGDLGFHDENTLVTVLNLKQTGEVNIGSDTFKSTFTASGNLNIPGTITATGLDCTDCVNTADIADATVTTAKLADDSVTAPKLLTDSDSLLKVSGGVMASDGTNIGIGTLTPERNLDITGDSAVLQLKATLAAGSAVIRLLGGGSNNTSSVINFGDQADDDVGQITYHHGAQAGDNQMDFKTNAAIRMSIDNVGNMGIGTDTPLANLHIDAGGTSPATGGHFILNNNASTGDGAILSLISGDTGQGAFRFGRTGDSNVVGLRGDMSIGSLKLEVNSGTVVTLTSSEHVGIGDTTPTTAKLTVQLSEASQEGIRISSQNGTAMMVVNRFGFMGIGNSDPEVELEVRGKVLISRSGATFLDLGDLEVTGNVNSSHRPRIGLADTAGTGQWSIQPWSAPGDGNLTIQRVAGTGSFSIPQANVGIGTDSPAAKLDVAGSAQFGSGVDKSSFTAAGFFVTLVQTKAELEAITPAIGQIAYCSDCDNNSRVLVGTGTLSGWAQFVGVVTWH